MPRDKDQPQVRFIGCGRLEDLQDHRLFRIAGAPGKEDGLSLGQTDQRGQPFRPCPFSSGIGSIELHGARHNRRVRPNTEPDEGVAVGLGLTGDQGQALEQWSRDQAGPMIATETVSAHPRIDDRHRDIPTRRLRDQVRPQFQLRQDQRLRSNPVEGGRDGPGKVQRCEPDWIARETTVRDVIACVRPRRDDQ